jgi:anti-anti-sigma factor
MAFAITSDGHGFILHGELDMANEQELAAAFDAVMGSGAPVTVDMRQLQVMDSSGIKVIIAAAKAAPSACIILHGVHDSVQRVVHMTRIEEVPNLHVMPCGVGV